MSNRPALISFPARLPGAWVRPLDEGYAPTAEERRCKRRVRQTHEVATALDVFWATALGVPLGAESEDAQLSRAAYIAIKHKLYRALYDIYDPIDAQIIAEEEWMRDTESPVSEEMGKYQFQEPMFEMACAWTMGLWDARLVAAFLWDLFRRVASGTPPNVCKWRDVDEIEFAGWRLGEHTGSWGRVGASSIGAALNAAVDSPDRSVASSLVPSPAQLRGHSNAYPDEGSPRRRSPGSNLGANAWKRMARSPRK